MRKLEIKEFNKRKSPKPTNLSGTLKSSLTEPPSCCALME